MSEEAVKPAADAVADEVVEPISKVNALVVRHPEFADFLEGLQLAYQQAHGVVFNLRTVKGDQEARKLRKQLVSARAAIDRRRIEKNQEDRQSIADRIAARDAGAAVLTEFVNSLWEPVNQQIVADEERRAREAEEARQREEERIANHVAALGRIKEVAERAVDAPAAEIEQKLALVAKMEIGEDWEEFRSKAQQTKDETLARLGDLLERARKLEAERQAAEANARELERLRAVDRERTEREAAERAERERQEAARRAAEEAERQQRERVTAAVRSVIDQIQAKQVEALQATSEQLVGIIEAIKAIEPGMDCGELDGQWQYARDSAIDRLTELRADKVERERKAEEERVRAARQAQIDANMRQFSVVQFQGTRDEIDAIQAALAQINAIEITEEAFGDQVELARQLKDGLAVRLELKLNAAILDAVKPPHFAPPAETITPVSGTEQPAGGTEAAASETGAPVIVHNLAGGAVYVERMEGATHVRVEGVEGDAAVASDGPWREEDDPSYAMNSAYYRAEIQQMHAGLLAAVARVCRDAKKSPGGRRFFVSADVIEELRNVLTAVQLPGGLRYTADGVLRNADGSEHVMEDN